MRTKNARTVGVVYHHSILHAMEVADRVILAMTGDQMRVTGLGEEGHSRNSKHYGVPGDIRTRAFDLDADADHIPPAILDDVVAELQTRLPREEFLVLMEGEGTISAHIHIGFQPKRVPKVSP